MLPVVQSWVLTCNRLQLSLFNDELESQKMARKALTVYVQRLEHAYNTHAVRDPVELYHNWKRGVTPSVVNDSDVCNLFCAICG